jgi:hypothetical protein
MFLLSFASVAIMSTSFDLWMSYGNVDTFALVINFLIDTWVTMHIIMGMFEVMIGQTMPAQLQYLLKFGLLH